MRSGLIFFVLIIIVTIIAFNRGDFEANEIHVNKKSYGNISFINTINGHGNEVNELTLPKGPITFDIYHFGSNEFAVWLTNTEGKYINLLAMKIGRFSIQKTIQINTRGKYNLEVISSGEWSISAQGKIFKKL